MSRDSFSVCISRAQVVHADAQTLKPIAGLRKCPLSKLLERCKRHIEQQDELISVCSEGLEADGKALDAGSIALKLKEMPLADRVSLTKIKSAEMEYQIRALEFGVEIQQDSELWQRIRQIKEACLEVEMRVHELNNIRVMWEGKRIGCEERALAILKKDDESERL